MGQETVRTYFDQAKDILKNSDRIYFYQAKFMDKKSLKMSADQIVNQSEIVMHAALTYLRSLKCGPYFTLLCLHLTLSLSLPLSLLTSRRL